MSNYQKISLSQNPVNSLLASALSRFSLGAEQVTSNGFLLVDNIKETVSFYFYFHFTFYQKLPSNILNLSSDTTSIYFDNTQSSFSNTFYKKSRLKSKKKLFQE